MSDKPPSRAPRVQRGARLARWAMWCALCTSSCQGESPAAHVTPIELPEGGALRAGTVLWRDAQPQPLVMSERAIYKRDDGAWRPIEFGPRSATRLFPGTSEEQLLWMPCPGQRQGNLLSHNGRLWMMTRGIVNATPRLWSVAPGEQEWREEVLPLPFQTTTRALRSRQASTRAQEDMGRGGICLFEHGERLHVMSLNRLWGLDVTPGVQARLRWEEIALQGVTDRAVASRPGKVPLMLRHYFPATEGYPYDILTVLGEQLQVYRRDARLARWVLVSVLPVIDLGMWRDERTGEVLIMTTRSLYKSRDLESWDRLPVLSREEFDEECTTFEVTPGPPHTILVGTNRGRLLRSDDKGQVFTQVRGRDRDRRDITQIMSASQEGESMWWALTAGEGVLLGEEDGKSWRKQNAGLTASMPTVIEAAGDELVLGTNSGLYIARDVPGAPLEWNRVLERAVTALRVTPKHVLVGTHGGAILATSLSRSEQSFQELAEESTPGHYPMMLPDARRGVELAPESIVALVARNQGVEVQAKTLGRGEWESLDGGDTWERSAPQPGLTEALSGHRMVQWLTPSESEVSYVLSRGLGGVGRSMLWRQNRTGGVWRNVTMFTQDESDGSLLYLVALSPQRLLKVQAGGLELSEDGGYSWRSSGVDVPMRALAASATPGGVLILGVNDEGAQVMRVTVDEAQRDQFEVTSNRLDVTFSRFEPEDVQEILWMNSRLIFRTTMGVWEAPLSQKPPRQSRSIALLLTMLGSMLMVTIAFLVVHGYRRERRP